MYNLHHGQSDKSIAYPENGTRSKTIWTVRQKRLITIPPSLTSVLESSEVAKGDFNVSTPFSKETYTLKRHPRRFPNT